MATEEYRRKNGYDSSKNYTWLLTIVKKWDELKVVLRLIGRLVLVADRQIYDRSQLLESNAPLNTGLHSSESWYLVQEKKHRL